MVLGLIFEKYIKKWNNIDELPFTFSILHGISSQIDLLSFFNIVYNTFKSQNITCQAYQ